MKITLQRLVKVTIPLMLVSVGACSWIHYPEKTFTDEQLVEKAADAIGVQESELSVVQGTVQSTQDEVSYRVRSTSGDMYRCYFTFLQGMVGYVTKGTGNANCNKIEGVLSGRASAPTE